MVVKLLKKRSQIVKEVTDTRCDIASLEDALGQAENEAKRIEDCVANECSKHLHIESVAEQQFGVAARERERLLTRLSLVESQNRQLNTELDKLRSSVGPRHRHNPVAYNNNAQGLHGAPAPRNVASSNEVVAVMNDRGVLLQAKQHGAVPSDSYIRGSLAVGDVRYLPDKVQHFSSGTTVSTKSCGQVLELSGASRHTGGHRTAQTRAGDVQTVPASSSSVNPPLMPTMVSVMTNSGSRISVAVSGASGQIYRQASMTGAAAASAGRSVPPPIPPNKPQVLITHPQLPAPHAGGGAAIRAIPVAQPSRPQTQVRYGVAFHQGRTALPDKPTLTAAVATISRQTPVLASQSGTSSHLAMVVGEATTVHKHPSQVCVDIK